MPKEVILDIKQKENKIKKYLPWVGIAVLIAGAFFIIGYGIGNKTDFELPLFQEETPTKSATRKNWYIHETRNFSIEYPKDWEVKNNAKDEPVGGTVLGSGGKVEFWFMEEKVYKFTQAQKKKQEKPTSSKLEIDGRNTTLVEYPFKEGDIFIVAQIPKSEKKPKVIFWINASNKDFRKTAIEIMSTFKTVTVSGKIGQLYE